MAAGAVGLAACTAQADLSAVTAEAARPVQRYDITQALASNGKVVVAGTQSGAVLVSADNGRSWKREMLGGVPDRHRHLPGWALRGGGFLSQGVEQRCCRGRLEGRLHRQAAHALAITCDAKGRWWVAGTGATLAVSADAGPPGR
jgi:photosystem II stability/assembly factor-like uncharacterized protein